MIIKIRKEEWYMLKKALVILFILTFTVASVYAETAKKKAKSPYKVQVIEATTSDNHLMKGKLVYKKPAKGEKVCYPTIIMLHSLGYSSAHWGSLPAELLKQGYAILAIDLRGHGNSNKDIKFNPKSWAYFTNKTYEKYPSDVLLQ